MASWFFPTQRFVSELFHCKANERGSEGVFLQRAELNLHVSIWEVGESQGFRQGGWSEGCALARAGQSPHESGAWSGSCGSVVPPDLESSVPVVSYGSNESTMAFVTG